MTFIAVSFGLSMVMWIATSLSGIEDKLGEIAKLMREGKAK